MCFCFFFLFFFIYFVLSYGSLLLQPWSRCKWRRDFHGGQGNPFSFCLSSLLLGSKCLFLIILSFVSKLSLQTLLDIGSLFLFFFSSSMFYLYCKFSIFSFPPFFSCLFIGSNNYTKTYYRYYVEHNSHKGWSFQHFGWWFQFWLNAASYSWI